MKNKRTSTVKTILIAALLFLMISSITCMTDPNDQQSRAGSVNCQLQFSKELLNQYSISTIELRIVTPDNNVLWGPQVFNYENHGATLDNVSPGEQYRVHARALEADGTLASSGFSQSFTVRSGQNTNAGTISLKTFGTFTFSGENCGSTTTFRLTAGDIDGDNDLDIIVSVALASGFNEVWINNGTGAFTFLGSMTGANGNNIETALGDLDGDGDLDAFTATYSDLGNRVWFNNGTGYFVDSGQYLGNGNNYSVALGDLDGDNDLDAYVANRGPDQNGGPNSVWINNGSGIFTSNGQLLGNAESLKVKLGDLDGDGDLDAYVANDGPTNEIGAPDKVWLNDGHGSFSDSGQNIGDRRTFEIDLGDVDSDGDLDIVTANLSGDVNQLWLNDGHGRFTNSGRDMSNILGIGVVLADFDSDGDLDIFFSNAYETPNTVWQNDGLGYFFTTGMQLGSSYTVSSVSGDFNNNGYADIVNANIQVSPLNEVWFFTPGQ